MSGFHGHEAGAPSPCAQPGLVNAFARAGLPAIAVRDTKPAAEGARPRDIDARRRRRAEPQPPLRYGPLPLAALGEPELPDPAHLAVRLHVAILGGQDSTTGPTGMPVRSDRRLSRIRNGETTPVEA